MQLLNVNELADFLKIKKSTIYDWTHRGVIPYFKIGKLLRFDLDAINKWVKNNSSSNQDRP